MCYIKNRYILCLIIKYCELPIESLLMFLNTDTRIAHSCLGHASTCPHISVITILARQGSLLLITSIPALLFVALVVVIIIIHFI